MPYTARITQDAKAFHDKMFGGFESSFPQTDPELIERFDNFAFDEVVKVADLDDETRYIGWLATLLGCQGIDEYCAIMPAALRNGMTPVQVKEVVYQAVAYLGIGRVFPFARATNRIFAELGIELPLEPQAQSEPTRESRLAAGEQAQVDIFGEGMRGFAQKGHPDYPFINEWLVANCFGDWYARGGLTLKQRELATFCYIAAQGGCDPQLKAHAAGNYLVGNPKELLVRVVASNLPFIGYPRSLNALAALDAAEADAAGAEVETAGAETDATRAEAAAANANAAGASRTAEAGASGAGAGASGAPDVAAIADAADADVTEGASATPGTTASAPERG